MIRYSLSLITLIASPAIACSAQMDISDARHLLSRTGFGAAPSEITRFSGLSRETGVELLLQAIDSDPTLPMPEWTSGWSYPYHQIWTLGQSDTDLFYTNRWLEIEELSHWWLAEMTATDSPLTERLALFWHDHFATSYDSHENGQWMANQNQFFRENAAGNFRTLARGILRDPAMLTYLTNTENVKSAPNENLGREYLELFTLGEGRGYTQADVKAAAAMLTGHTVSDYGDWGYYFNKDEHDRSLKSIFGQEGRFGADDLADLALNHPDFGPYIVEKLWLEFISSTPDPAEIQRLTVLWLENDLELRPLLRAMFMSDAFWDKSNRGSLVKSPVELIVGTTRTLGIDVPNAGELAWVIGELGQNVFFPPNVGGWPHGTGWVTDATATARATFMNELLNAHQEGFEPEEVASSMMATSIPQASSQPALDADDLRVGQVFAINTDHWENWLRAEIVLFDVGFRGKDIRSIPLYLEYDSAENFAELSLNAVDCEGRCLGTLANHGEYSEWVTYEPWGGFISENPDLSEEDAALISAIAANLSELLRGTATQTTWQDGYQNRPIEDVLKATDILARDSIATLGAPKGKLVSAFSQPEKLGLAGAAVGQMMAADLDQYAQAQAQSRTLSMTPPSTFATLENWLHSLPETGNLADYLMAVAPKMNDQTNRSQQSLRQLLVSPEYQVN